MFCEVYKFILVQIMIYYKILYNFIDSDNEVKELSKKRAQFTKLSDTILTDFLNDESDTEGNENDESEKQKVIDDKAARKVVRLF